MKEQLEVLLERMNCTDEASLKEALDRLIKEGRVDDEQMDEAVALRLSLEKKDLSRLDAHARELTESFLCERKEEAARKATCSVWIRRWIPIAALLVIVVGISAFSGFVGVVPPPPLTHGKESTEEVSPSSDRPPVTTVTNRPSVSTAPPHTTVAYVPPISYTPGGAQEGPGIGGPGDAYNLAYDLDFFAVEESMFDLVSEEAAKEWKNRFQNGKGNPSDSTLYGFLMHFGISREQAEAVNEKYLQTIGPIVPQEMIERIYTWSAEEVYEFYAYPSTVLVETRAYTPQWLVEHSAEQARAEGITSRMLAEKMHDAGNACRNWEQLRSLCRRLEELRALEASAGESVQVFDVGRWISRAPRVAAGWLALHSAEEWKQEGVELSAVEENLKRLVYACKDREQIGEFVHRLRQVKQEWEPDYVFDGYRPLKEASVLTPFWIADNTTERCYEAGLTIELAEEYLQEILFAHDERYFEENRSKWGGGLMVMLKELAELPTK